MRGMRTAAKAACAVGASLLLVLAFAGQTPASHGNALGHLFISSTDGDLVKRFDLDGSAAPPSATMPGAFPSAEGMACGPDGKVYVALSGIFDGPANRRIVRLNEDGTGLETVLDFPTTPALVGSGGPEGPSFGLLAQDDGRLVPSGELFFNTRAVSGVTYPHTGAWKLPAPGGTPVQVIPPFAGASGNGEGTAFLTSGPYAGHLLVVDFPNGRVLRRAPPFVSAVAAVDFITGLAAPNGVAVKPNAPDAGQIFVAESLTTNIKRFTSTGTPVGPPDGFFVMTGLVQRKIGFDEGGNLYVATVSPGDVLRYSPPSTGSTTIGTVPGGNGVTVCPRRIAALIDIKPGSFPNPINVRSRGTIPVAILSTPYFDAPSGVNQSTLRFGPPAVLDGGGGAPPERCNVEDANGDGRVDLVCHFRTQLTGFTVGGTEGAVRWGNQDFEGRASVLGQ